MSYNLSEQARKDAGLPGFVKGVPKKGQARANVTGEMFALFKEAVDKRVGFLMDELGECRDARIVGQDKITDQALEIFRLKEMMWEGKAGERVGDTARSLDLAANDVKRLQDSVEGSVAS